MRNSIQIQIPLGQPSIESLKINTKSRDDIPAALLGLKTIFLNLELREKVLSLLEQTIVSDKKSLTRGRPGMDLWRILVLGTLRLTCDIDYDRLHDLANEHASIRVMLMTSGLDAEIWTLDTIAENVRLLKPEVLDQINQLVVEAGHKFLKKKDENPVQIAGRCDSFVVETNVHYPTDISLLFDASRKIIQLMMKEPSDAIQGFRQGSHLKRKMKSLVRQIGIVRHLRRNPSEEILKNPIKNAKKIEQMKTNQANFLSLHRELIQYSNMIIERAESNFKIPSTVKKQEKVEYFITHAKRQIDQITRRIFKNEKISPAEKVYSIFEPHTEWIMKGKAGVPQELGLRVAVIEDQYGFILHHRVMEKETDDKVAVSMVKKTKTMFQDFESCSFDKGFHSPQNKKELQEILNFVVLPKKGKLSLAQSEEETAKEFVRARNQHSAVESAINCLEHHGLGRCPDRGIKGFRRYVSLAILARNIYQLGRLALNQLREQEKKLEKKIQKPPLAA